MTNDFDSFYLKYTTAFIIIPKEFNNIYRKIKRTIEIEIKRHILSAILSFQYKFCLLYFQRKRSTIKIFQNNEQSIQERNVANARNWLQKNFLYIVK